MSDSGRLWLPLTLTNTNGAISHVDQNGKTVTRVLVGHFADISLHIYGINGHTIQVWGSNESKPDDATNAIQIGTDITGNSLLNIETGPLWIFIEVGTAGTGQPTCIVTGRHKVG